MSNFYAEFAFDVWLPEVEIGGLYFNAQKVHITFVEAGEGLYYSDEALFVSYRNVILDNERDVLSEYLDRVAWRGITKNLVFCTDLSWDDFRLSLPVEPIGQKKYHGVYYPYWLQGKEPANAANFRIADSTGLLSHEKATELAGVVLQLEIDPDNIDEEDCY